MRETEKNSFMEREANADFRFLLDGLEEELQDFLKVKPNQKQLEQAGERLLRSFKIALIKGTTVDWDYVLSGIEESAYDQDIRLRLE